MQVPNATNNKPMPISAYADQWQWGKPSSPCPQTLNKKFGPNAINSPKVIITAPKIITFSCFPQKANPALL